MNGKKSNKLKNIKSRYKWALYFVCISICISALFGLIFALVLGDLSGKFLEASKICFLWFFAWAFVSAMLLLFTKIPEELSMGFGAGIYYGTAVSAYMIRYFFEVQLKASYGIGFIITILVCYIVWLKNFKRRYSSEEE